MPSATGEAPRPGPHGLRPPAALVVGLGVLTVFGAGALSAPVLHEVWTSVATGAGEASLSQDSLHDDLEVRDGPLGLSLATTSVSFGALTPGQSSQRSTVAVENVGAVPLRLQVAASPLVHEGGLAEVAAERHRVATDGSAPGEALAQEAFARPGDILLAPAEQVVLHFWVEAPHGGEGWLPAGTYAGSLTIGAQEVLA